MIRVQLATHADFDGFRREARRMLSAGCKPEEVVFATDDAQDDLFAADVPPVPSSAETLAVPRAFFTLAQRVVCHSDSQRYSLLYRMLWRLQRGERFLADSADDDVYRARHLAKAVQRERHKMKAFVRFRKVTHSEWDAYVAWFEPEHHIVESVAPFFARRFTGMRWSIMTPRCCAHWDGRELAVTDGAPESACPRDDELEELWRTYYASIFNPARLKVNAMRSEMPQKYWRNLPEARLIPQLIRDGERARDWSPEGTPVSREKAQALNDRAAARRRR